MNKYFITEISQSCTKDAVSHGGCVWIKHPHCSV